MAGLVGHLETEVKIKSSPEQFLHTYRLESHLVPKTTPHNLHTVEFHEGDFQSFVAVKQWTYSIDGIVEVVKGRIEIDEENLKITSYAQEGHLTELYKSFICSFQVIPAEEGSLVKWKWDYEKVNEDVPDPTKFITIANSITKDVDSHIISKDVTN